MDVDTIDREFSQLQQEAGLGGQTIEAFAGKLQVAGDTGDANAKSWLLDLKGIALQIQQEQLQVQNLLEALHEYVAASALASPGQPGSAGPNAIPAAEQLSAGEQSQPATKRGFFSGGFGQAIATVAGMGAGFGMTDSFINSIFS